MKEKPTLKIHKPEHVFHSAEIFSTLPQLRDARNRYQSVGAKLNKRSSTISMGKFVIHLMLERSAVNNLKGLTLREVRFFTFGVPDHGLIQEAVSRVRPIPDGRVYWEKTLIYPK